jgi:hypothetical protein
MKARTEQQHSLCESIDKFLAIDQKKKESISHFLALTNIQTDGEIMALLKTSKRNSILYIQQKVS